MTRVLVCGGRDYNDAAAVARALSQIMPAVIIHGAARGADRLAVAWARRNSVDVEPYPAHWARHGRAAGPIRNQTMLDKGKPDLVVAFPGGRGTMDMIRRAKAAGLPVLQKGEWP